MSVTLGTLGDLVTAALTDTGITGQGQTPSPEDSNKAWLLVNILIPQWARKRWLVYHLVTLNLTSTGAMTYSIGPAGDFNTPNRIDKLESAFLRQPIGGGLPVDYPLELILAREDYNRIRLKTLTSFPSSVFLDSDYPLGTLYFWPIPQASIYEMFVTIKQPFSTYTGLTSSLNLPPEYQAALYYNLIVRLRAAYRMPPDPIFVALAKDALNVIRNANAQIPRLQMPGTVLRSRPNYNILSDTP